MINYIIPTTVIDNFFDDPAWVRNYALQQEYAPDEQHLWPGKRTKPLHELDVDFFNYIIARFVSVFYNLEQTHIKWNVQAYFQLVSKDFQEGWVHVDREALVTGIVYLNPTDSSGAGTTIYQAKIPGASIIHHDKKIEAFTTPTDSDQLSKFRDENNNQFEETIVLKNKFNRLVAFDSHLYHAANDFELENGEERLTLVFFIHKLDVDRYPLQRMNRV